MEEQAVKPISLILIDDDPHILYFLEYTFRSVGITVAIERIKNGEDFIHLLEEQEKNPDRKIDCVLMDLNMPRKNGWETLAEMKEKNLGGGIPIIVISHSHQSNVEELLRLGAAAFIAKPTGLDEYKDFVRKVASYGQRQSG